MSLTVLRELWAKLYAPRRASVTQKIRGEAHVKSEKGTSLSHLCQLTEPHRRECAVCPEGVQECHAIIVSPGEWGSSRSTYVFLQNPADLKATLMEF